MYIHRDAAQQNIWQIRIGSSVRPAQEASLSQGCPHAALVRKETRFDLCAMPHALLTENPYSSWTNSTTSRFSAGFRAFFRSHPSRPDFPGLSPHTLYVLGSPARFDRLQDCDDLVFRKLWLLHGSLLGMVYQKSPVLVCTILREGYIFIQYSLIQGDWSQILGKREVSYFSVC